jgi:hypothetical protein
MAEAPPPCRRLKTKRMYVDWEDDPDVPGTFDGFFWCTHSMNCLGPDGKIAVPEDCHPGRRCYDP